MERATRLQERKGEGRDAGAKRTGRKRARVSRKRLSPSSVLQHERRCQERSLLEFS